MTCWYTTVRRLHSLLILLGAFDLLDAEENETSSGHTHVHHIIAANLFYILSSHLYVAGAQDWTYNGVLQ